MIRHLRLLVSLCFGMMVLSLSAQNELTVANGTDNNEYIPIYGLFADELIQNQMIYPASALTSMEGYSITSITFYLSSLPSSSWSCNFQCKLGITNTASFPASPNQFISTSFTTVFSGPITLNGSTSTLTLTFSTPFTYSGGNLLVNLLNMEGCDDYLEASFYGISTSNLASAYAYDDFGDWYITSETFLPKTTFTFSQASACLTPQNLIISNITTHSATLDITPADSNDTQWEVRCEDANQNTLVINTTNPNNILLQNLQPASYYTVFARTLCGQDDSSAWTSAQGFYTNCLETMTIPQFWGFEDEWVPSDAFGQNNYAPLCWTVFNGGAFSPSYQWNWMHSTGSTVAHSGTGAASCYTDMATEAHNDWLISPQLALTGTQQLSFFARRANSYTSDPEEISVWISDENISLMAPDSANGILPGFTQLFQTEIPQGDYRQFNVSLAGYSGNRHLAFVRRNAPFNGNYLRLDDITIDEASNFPPMVPYHCDFEDPEENSAWGLVNDTQTNQWVIDTAVNHTAGGHSALYVSQNNGLTNTYSFNSTSNVWTYRDLQFPEASEFHLSFDWRGNGEACCDYLKVYIGAPATVTAGVYATPSGATVLFNKLNEQSDWNHASITLGHEYANTTQRLYFLWRNDNYTGSNPPAAIDNLSIDTISCAQPAQLAFSDITATSATVHISPASETDAAWQLMIDTLLLTTNNTVTPLINLSPAHLYTVMVRTICTGGDTSVWTTPQTFSTECVTLSSIPQTWDFESDNHGGTAAYPLPTCWSRLGSSIYPYTYSYASYAHSGNNLLYSGGDPSNYMVILPEIDTALVHISLLQLSLYAKSYSASSVTSAKVEIGVMSNPSDASSFLSLDSITAIGDIYTDYAIPLLNAPAGYSYIALRLNASGDTNLSGQYNYAYLYLDDITLEERPLCQKPSQLDVSDITTSSATLSWLNGGDESAWDLAYGTPGFNPDTTANIVTVNTNPYTLTGLDSRTTYEVYVRANCGNNETSAWISAPVSFTTAACELADQCDYVFLCGDGYGDGWNNAYLTILQDGFTVATVSALDHHQAGTPTVDTLRMPLCHLTSTELVWNAGSHDSEISLNIIDANGVLIYSNDNMSTCTSTILANFLSNCSDSILCPGPDSIITHNISQNHTEVSWTPVGHETLWELQYKMATSSNWGNSIFLDTTYYVLGLVSHRNYNLRLRSICDDINKSDFLLVDFTSGLDGISSNELSQHISLTPNPADSYIELSVSNHIEVKEAAVFNAFGQLIRTVQLTDNHARLDLSNMASGLYFVRLSNDHATATKKFIKK